MMLQTIENRELAKLVRETIKKAGWDIWSTYSDKRKEHRRYKFMRNGWRVPGKLQKRIYFEVHKELKEYINVLSCGWEVGQSYRGAYDYFYVKVKL